MSDNLLYMWVVYDHPADYPDHYVVRTWATDGTGNAFADPDVRLADSLEEVRACFPEHVRLPRQEDDDPAIVEVYV